MVLACLADVHDPALIPQVLYMHDAYSRSVPNVAANYVKSLGCPKRVKEVVSRQIELTDGKTVYQFIRDRLNTETFTHHAVLTEGCSLLEKKRISAALTHMLRRYQIERIGKRRSHSFRLVD